MLLYISFGSEISDRPSCWNGITKSMVVNPSLYYTNSENFWASKRPLDLEVAPQSDIHDTWNIGET
jgi:hypothetical protein